MKSRLTGPLACGCMFVALVSVSAQNAALDEYYGDGVHAYFAGDNVRAFQNLTSAALAGSKDPRVYYFRGLACLRLGREPDAALDFDRGAKLETGETDRFYDISKAARARAGRATVWRSNGTEAKRACSRSRNCNVAAMSVTNVSGKLIPKC